MNKKRLLLLIAFAAAVGASLPYLELLISHNLRAGWLTPTVHPVIMHGKLQERRTTAHFADSVFMVWYNGPLSQEQWDQVRTSCEGLLPADALDMQNQEWGMVGIVKFGWPCRAVHLCSKTGAHITQMTTSTIWERPKFPYPWLENHTPPILPTGILWGGMLSNIALTILLFALPYAAFEHWRARRKAQLGLCRHCNYPRGNSPLCPECGSAL